MIQFAFWKENPWLGVGERLGGGWGGNKRCTDQLRDYAGNNHPSKRCEIFSRLVNTLLKNQMLKNETMIYILGK